jgi:hypothetical protein
LARSHQTPLFLRWEKHNKDMGSEKEEKECEKELDRKEGK